MRRRFFGRAFAWRCIVLTLLLGGALTGAAPGFAQDVLTVTNTEDDGPGSLRKAIEDANAAPGADAIRFVIPGPILAGAHVIAPLSPLPAITEAVTIDGTTQPGYSAGNGLPRVQIIGTDALTSEFDGLTLAGTGITVRGLSLNRCGNAGIRLLPGANGAVIEKCFIGTDFAGENPLGNAVGILAKDVQNVVIRNCVLSANGTGVSLFGDVTDTVIEDCYIGTDRYGFSALGNGLGVAFNDTTGGKVDRCLIAANEFGGVLVGTNFAQFAFIQNCRFGVSDYEADLPNGGDAVALVNAQYCVVERNVIAFSFGAGISVSGTMAQGNFLPDNFIGANVNGVRFDDHASDNQIYTLGGAGDYSRIQSNYGDGVYVASDAGSGNRVEQVVVENNLGNGVAAYANGFTVAGCFLNDNGLYGVFVGREDRTKPYAERVRVTGSTFKNNGDLAIRLDGSKTTGKGGNKLQPAPTLSQALADGSGPTAVVGSLFAAPNKTYTVEFFAAEEADPSGYGEGEIFLGSKSVTTDAGGNASFVASGLPTVQKGMWVSATATDPDGNTSEFSLAVVTESNPAPILESISPDTKIAGSPGFTLIVTGKDFKPNSQIQWDGQPRTTTFISDTELRTQITAADILTPRTLAVSVYTPAPGGGVSAPLTFTVANPAPVLATIAPDKVLAGSGAVTITLNGAKFVSGSVVRFNGTDRTTTFVSSTQLTVVLSGSDTATAGYNNVTVFTPGPGGGESAAQTFTVENPVPTITGMNPTSAFAGSSALTVTIDGTGFVSGSVVSWDNAPRPTTYVTGTRVRVEISRDDLTVVGAHSLIVNTPGPGGGNSNAGRFTVIGVPQLALSSATATRANGETLVVFTVKNVGSATATNLSLKSSKLGPAATLTALPQALGNLAAGVTSAPFTVRFPGDVPVGAAVFQLNVKASGKLFSASRRVTVPQ